MSRFSNPLDDSRRHIGRRGQQAGRDKVGLPRPTHRWLPNRRRLPSRKFTTTITTCGEPRSPRRLLACAAWMNRTPTSAPG